MSYRSGIKAGKALASPDEETAGAHAKDFGPDHQVDIFEDADGLAATWLGALHPLILEGADKLDVEHRLGELLDRFAQGNATERLTARQFGVELAVLCGGNPRVIGVSDRVFGQALEHAQRARRGSIGFSRGDLGQMVEGYCDRARELVFHDQQLIHESVLGVMWDAQQALFESESRFRAVFESATIGILICDINGRIMSINPVLLKPFGGDLATHVGKRATVLFSALNGDERLILQHYFELVRNPSQQVDVQGELTLVDGSSFWANIVSSVVKEKDGPARYIISMIQDISDRHTRETLLRQNEERVRQLIRNSSDMIAVVDASGTVEFMSPNVERILGFDADSLEGKPFRDIITVEGLSEFELMLEDVRDRKSTSVRGEIRCKYQDNSWRWMEIVCAEMENDWSTNGIVITARDVTERKAFQLQLERQAYFDGLTALPNRLRFRTLLDAALSADAPVAVLFIDLDRFKLINDSQDHGGGDHAIVAVGQRILETLVAGETVGRLGGDEFAVLVDDATIASAFAAANRIIEALARPVALQHYDAPIECSIGIALSGSETDTSNSLLRAADIAMYKAKALGGCQAALFDPDMLTEAVKRAEHATALHHALERNEFETWYQPEYDLNTGVFSSFEASVRWRRPGHDILDLEDFRDIAIETGLMPAINHWLIADSARQVANWSRQGIDKSLLLFNVAYPTHSLGQDRMLEALGEILKETGLEPERLRIDLDSRMISERDLGPDGIDAGLHRLGVYLGVDNFGIGSNSLTFLRRMNAQMIKFNRGITSNDEDRDTNRSIMSAVTRLAHAVGVSVTTVGLDSPDQVEQARLAGCDRGLGEAFAPRLLASDMETLLLKR